jgi:hypothetical protein
VQQLVPEPKPAKAAAARKRSVEPRADPVLAPTETVADYEAQMAMLRDLKNLVANNGTPTAEQLDLLGQRRPFDGDLADLELVQASNEREWPRVPVNEGYNIADLRDDRLPDPGL